MKNIEESLILCMRMGLVKGKRPAMFEVFPFFDSSSLEVLVCQAFYLATFWF